MIRSLKLPAIGLRTMSLLCGCLLMSTTGAAQSPHVSKIYGYTSLECPEGVSLVSISMVKPDLAQGTITGSTTSGLTTSAPGGYLANVIDGVEGELYVEIISGSASVQGHRFEIDKGATVSASNSQIICTQNSLTNTVWPLPNLAGAKFVIREHITVGDVFGRQGNALLHGTGMASSSDRVSFYNSASKQYLTIWFRKNASGTVAQWRAYDATDTFDYTDTPISPGTGAVLYRQPGAGPVKLYQVGQVRMTPMRLPLAQGYTLASHNLPLDHSPSMAGMLLSTGWQGGSSSSQADKFQIWNGSDYSDYWFRSESNGSVEEWRSMLESDPLNYMNSSLFHGDKAIFIYKKSADLDYLMTLQPGTP